MKTKTISEMLKEMLALKGVTQQVLGDDLNLNQSTISRLQRSKITDRQYLVGKEIEKHYRRLVEGEF